MIWLVTDVALGRSSDCLSPIYSDAAKWPLSYGRLFFEGRAWCGNITRQVERRDARGTGKGIPPDHVPCAMWMPLPEIRTQSFWQYCPDGCFSLSHIENGHSLSPFLSPLHALPATSWRTSITGTISFSSSDLQNKKDPNALYCTHKRPQIAGYPAHDLHFLLRKKDTFCQRDLYGATVSCRILCNWRQLRRSISAHPNSCFIKYAPFRVSTHQKAYPDRSALHQFLLTRKDKDWKERPCHGKALSTGRPFQKTFLQRWCAQNNALWETFPRTLPILPFEAIMTEFLYHAISGVLILCCIVLFIWKARTTHFPKEEKKVPMILDEKIQPQKKRILGFMGRLF